MTDASRRTGPADPGTLPLVETRPAILALVSIAGNLHIYIFNKRFFSSNLRRKLGNFCQHMVLNK